MAAALVGCAAGAGLVLLAAGRTWVQVTVPRPAPLPPVVVPGSGGTLEPVVTALAVVGLAGTVGLVATRRTGRVVLGALLAAAGLVVAVRALPHLATPSHKHALDLVEAHGRTVGLDRAVPVAARVAPVWPLLAAAGGLVLAAGGGLAVVRGRSWPGMSGRYDAPAARPDGAPVPVDTAGARPHGARPERGMPSSAQLWDAMDAGQDPTEP